MKTRHISILIALILAITSFALAEGNNDTSREFTADEQAYDVYLDLSHVFDYGVRYLDELDRLWVLSFDLKSASDANSSWFYDAFLMNRGNASSIVDLVSDYIGLAATRYGYGYEKDSLMKLHSRFLELLGRRTAATDTIWAGIALDIEAHYLESPDTLKEYLDNAMAGIRSLMRIDRDYPFLSDLQDYYKEAAWLYEYIDEFKDNYSSFSPKRDEFSKKRSSYAIDFEFIFDTSSDEYAYVNEVRARKNAERNQAGFERAQVLEDAGDYDGAIAVYWEYYSEGALERIRACREKLEEAANQQVLAEMEAAYQDAVAKEGSGHYKEAIEIFKSLEDYKDSFEHLVSCVQMLRLISEKRITYGVQDGKEWVDNEKEFLYRYNGNGIRTSVEEISTLPTKEEYTVDETGRILSGKKTGQWSSDAKYTFTSVMEYDAHNNLTKETKTYRSPDNWLHKNGSVGVETYKYTYGESDEILSKAWYLDGQLTYTYTYEYKYDDQGRLEEMKEFTNGQLSGTYTYYYIAGDLLEKVVKIGAPIKTTSGSWYYRTEYIYEYE